MSGHGAGFYGMAGIELVCINLGESAAFVGGEAFQKPAPAALTCPVHSCPSFGKVGAAMIFDLPCFCPTCPTCPRRDRFGDEPDARSEPFLALATVCLRLSVLSIHELMCKYTNAPMFLSRGDASGQGLSKVGSHKKDVLLHPPGFPPARE